ncbi:MAG: alpha/beta fold hydrolase [Pseudomonadota bacterium]
MVRQILVAGALWACALHSANAQDETGNLDAQNNANNPENGQAEQPAASPETAIPSVQAEPDLKLIADTQFDDLVMPDATLPTIVPTEHFANRSAFRRFQLSPDGENLMMIVIVDGKSMIVLVDPETKQLNQRFAVDEDQDIEWVRWAGNQKLLISVSYPFSFYGIPVRGDRLVVYDLAANQGFPLEVSRGVIWGGDLVHLDESGEYALISVQQNNRSNPSVYRYPLISDGKREKIVNQKTGVWSWYADDDGVVRLGMGYRRKRLRVYYREDAGAKFKLVGKLKADDDRARYWSVVKIISGSDRGYVLEEGENGRVGVRLFDYSTGEPVETFYENPDWDVEELWLKKDGTPLAAFYTDDRERIVWFDDEQEKLYNRLRKAVQMEDVHIISRSDENKRMMVWAGSEADPGALYVFTPEERKLDVFANYRPDLDFQQLTKPQPIRYTARDGLKISAYLTLPRGRSAKNLPLIILPHGGPYGVRDMLQYNDEVQLLANRGYAVLQPNFRGSGGYGEDFFEKGTGQIGRLMQDDLDDAMDWAVEQGIADPKRVCLVGGSYGGYASLWGVLRNPERYRCAASWAGVTDLDAILKYDRKFLGRKAGKAWRQRVEGAEEFDVDTVSPLARAAQLSRPVLLAHGTKDSVVPFSQFKKFEKASREAPSPPITLIIDDEGHGFSSPENEQQWYDALVKFLETYNPPDVIESPKKIAPNATQS